MNSETISARLLARDDVIRVEGQDGWYVVDSTFQEGPVGPVDLDLHSEDDLFRYNWHVGPDH